jgi:hypothetical protein
MDHAALIRPFLSRAARARFDNIDPGSKKRSKLLHRLCHEYESILDWRLAQPIAPTDQTAAAIAALLREMGSGGSCYVLCISKEWDGQQVSLRAALDALVGEGRPVLLVISESLAYFEPEYVRGAGQRFVLRRNRTSANR